MTGYPDAPLDLRAELLLGGTWTDVTGWAMPDGQQYAQISGGTPDGAQQANPASMSVSWDNPDGRFSPRNANSPWYGLLHRNVPCRVSVAGNGGTYLRCEEDTVSGASCPDAAPLRLTSGVLDIRVDIDLSDYRACALFWSYGTGVRSWDLEIDNAGRPRLFWSPDGTSEGQADCQVPLPFGRVQLRAVFTVATGVVTFYTSTSGDISNGPWTMLGAAAQGPATGLHASSAGLNVGGGAMQSFYGKMYAAQLRSGDNGTILANPDFTAQAAGTTSFADGYGNTWSVTGTASITDRDYRLHGEVSSLAPTVDSSGGNPKVTGQLSGLLRRIQQGNAPPVQSTMRRALPARPGLVAYWPMEEGEGATQFGSATGGAPLLISGGPPSLAADSSFACSLPLPTTGGGLFRGTVAGYQSTGVIVCRFLLVLGATAPVQTIGWPFVRLITSGTCVTIDFNVFPGYNLGIEGGNANGVVFSNANVNFGLNSPSGTMQAQPCWASLELQQSGGTVNYALVVAFPGQSTAWETAGSFGGKVGTVQQVRVNGGIGQMPDTAIGHISVQSAWESMFNLATSPAPLDGYTGESAAGRFSRICGENDLPCRIYGGPAISPAMGPQPADTIWNILTECQLADQGLVYDHRDARAIGYRTLASMLNQSPRLTLDYALANLPGDLAPAEDDTDLVNDWTVTRTNGSSARAVLDDGTALSVTDPAAGGAGRYATSQALNLEYDVQLADAAGWRLRQSAVDAARFRQVTVNAGIPGAPVKEMAALRPGDLMQILHPPALLQTDPVRQIVTGATETLGPGRSITWDCVPGASYVTGIVGDPVLGRADTDGSSLNVAATATATSLSVATAAGNARWTTAAADFPFDIGISGERITVTGISGTTSPQTFTVTRSVNGVAKAHPAGADVRLWQPGYVSPV